MVTKLALEDSGRSQLVEAFAQLSGLPVYTCQMRSPHTQSVSKMVSRLHSRARTLSPPPRHPGLRLLIPDSRDLASSEGFTAPDAGLLRLLPIVGTPDTPVILLKVSESHTYVTLQWYITNAEYWLFITRTNVLLCFEQTAWAGRWSATLLPLA